MIDKLITEEFKLLLEKDPFEKKDSKEDPFSDKDGGKDVDPFSDDSDTPGDSGGPDSEGDSEGDSEDSSGDPVTLFSEKTSLIKKIKYQRTDKEPNFDFSTDGRFFIQNYVGISPKGSMIIATPQFKSIEDYSTSDFFKNSVLYRIYKCAKNAVEEGKKIVFMGDYGLPVYGNKYQNNEQGIIAKFLFDQFGNRVSFDTWIPKEYNSFMAKTSIWNELKKTTEMSGDKIKAAVYLYLVLWHGNEELTDKLFTEKVKNILYSWGLPDYVTSDINYGDNKTVLAKFLYPELDRKPENEASYIIKTYYHLLLKDLIINMLKYEQNNKIVIVATSKDVAWQLVPSLKNLDLMSAENTKKEKE